MRKILILVIGISIILLGVFFWWNNGLSAVNGSDKSEHIFVVAPGKGVRELANQLKKEGLIKDPVVFFLLVKQLGLDNKIQAGDFRLSPSMTAEQIAKNLTHGTLDIWVTVPEGKRAEEVAEILKEKISGYQDSWKTTLREHEGFLFPDTYLIPTDANIDTIVSLMKNNFDKKYAELKNTSKQTSLSQKEIVTLASLIEREAKFAEDRPLIASVLFNRLDKEMPLQIDATVQYILGYQPQEKTWWKRHLSFDDLKVRSSYNTYLNTGFPPGPIANPGLSALSAVLAPAQTDYIFYISDSTGHNHYSKTLEGHESNIKKHGL